MKQGQGFSLFEILITLVLITSLGLGLLQQQWQLNRLVHQLLKSTEALVFQDNLKERQ